MRAGGLLSMQDLTGHSIESVDRATDLCGVNNLKIQEGHREPVLSTLRAFVGSHRATCSATNAANLSPETVPTTIQSNSNANRVMATAFCACFEYCWERNHSAFPSLQSNETIKAPSTSAEGTATRYRSVPPPERLSAVVAAATGMKKARNRNRFIRETCPDSEFFEAALSSTILTDSKRAIVMESWVTFSGRAFERPHPLEHGLRNGFRVVSLSHGRADVPERVPTCYRRAGQLPEDSGEAAPSNVLNAMPFAPSVGSMTRSTNFVRLIG
jgi:hypothetical protein